MRYFKLWNGVSWRVYSQQQMIDFIFNDEHDDGPYEEPGAWETDRWVLKEEPNLCQTCKEGTMRRDHVIEDYVMWECDKKDCTGSEMETLGELDEAGWAWLKNHYQGEK